MVVRVVTTVTMRFETTRGGRVAGGSASNIDHRWLRGRPRYDLYSTSLQTTLVDGLVERTLLSI